MKGFLKHIFFLQNLPLLQLFLFVYLSWSLAFILWVILRCLVILGYLFVFKTWLQKLGGVPVYMVRLVHWRTFDTGSSLVAQMVKNPPSVSETGIQSLGWEDPLEKGMATHSNILAWRIPWTEDPGRLQSTWLQKLDPTEQLFFTWYQCFPIFPCGLIRLSAEKNRCTRSHKTVEARWREGWGSALLFNHLVYVSTWALFQDTHAQKPKGALL